MILDDLYAQVDAGKAGVFSGLPLVEWHGEIDYLYHPSHFFTRWTGEKVTPWKEFKTDGGSLPRFLWGLPGMNPWTYFPAYVIHDFCYTFHEKGNIVECTFDEANLILAEMLVVMGCPRERVTAIYEAVELGGKSHWEK